MRRGTGGNWFPPAERETASRGLDLKSGAHQEPAGPQKRGPAPKLKREGPARAALKSSAFRQSRNSGNSEAARARGALSPQNGFFANKGVPLGNALGMGGGWELLGNVLLVGRCFGAAWQRRKALSIGGARGVTPFSVYAPGAWGDPRFLVLAPQGQGTKAASGGGGGGGPPPPPPPRGGGGAGRGPGRVEG